MNLLRFLFIITSIVAIIFNGIDGLNIIFLLLATVCSVLFTIRYPFHGNYAKYLILLVFWFSLIFMPAFHLVDTLSTRYIPISQAGLNKLLNFGIPVYLWVSSLFILFPSFNIRKCKDIHYQYSLKPLNENGIKIFLVFCILLSLFCISIGLGRMGSEGVKLPFHLGGFINLFH